MVGDGNPSTVRGFLLSSSSVYQLHVHLSFVDVFSVFDFLHSPESSLIRIKPLSKIRRSSSTTFTTENLLVPTFTSLRPDRTPSDGPRPVTLPGPRPEPLKPFRRDPCFTHEERPKKVEGGGRTPHWVWEWKVGHDSGSRDSTLSLVIGDTSRNGPCDDPEVVSLFGDVSFLV